MSAFDYASLKTHVGHKIECVTYGNPKTADNVAVECVTCHEVLLDYDRPKGPWGIAGIKRVSPHKFPPRKKGK